VHPCTGRTAHRGSRGIALLVHDHGTRREWGVSVTPRSLFTPGKDPVPIVQWLGGPQGRSAQVRKISPPPGFDPRTVQPIASRYTDWATRPTCNITLTIYQTRTAKHIMYCFSYCRCTWLLKLQNKSQVKIASNIHTLRGRVGGRWRFTFHSKEIWTEMSVV